MSEHISPEIEALIARGNVTLVELIGLRCNSWEWQALVPAMTDEAFIDRMQYALDNCFTPHRRPFSTYNEAVEGLWAPELLKRFKRLSDLALCLRNIGFDITCGACAEQFYTGAVMHDHDETCRTIEGTFEQVIDAVREALGMDVMHYLIIADNVKDLVEAVELSAQDGGVAARKKLRELRDQGRPPSTITASGGPGGPHERIPAGHPGAGNINNCSLANGEKQEDCQVCSGRCPDRDRFKEDS